MLAILAARLGWGPIQAVDVDPLAVAATRENAPRNGVALEAWQADALADPLPAVPLGARQPRAPPAGAAARARAGCPRGCSSPVCSSDEPLDHAGWRAADRADRGGWRALLLERL